MRRFLSILASLTRFATLAVVLMLACLAPQAEALLTSSHPGLSAPIPSQAHAPESVLIIEEIHPIGYADDGDCLDLCVCVEPETLTRVFCIVKSPTGLEAYLFFQDEWHLGLVVKDEKQWLAYDFHQKERRGLNLTGGDEHRTRLQKGVDGLVEVRVLTDAKFKEEMKQSNAAWRLRTSVDEDKAMVANIWRQYRSDHPPSYKVTTVPWTPDDKEEGLCVQRAIQMVNRNTRLDLPMLWVESALTLVSMAPNYKPTYLPFIVNLDKAAKQQKRDKGKEMMINGKVVPLMERIKPIPKDNDEARAKGAMERFYFVDKMLKKGIRYEAIILGWNIKHSEYLIDRNRKNRQKKER